MGWYILISILILITCFLIVLVVLVQNSKGGGLASNFSASNQIMGVRKTADFLEKATWTLAGILLFLSLITVFTIPKLENSEKTVKSEVTIKNMIPAQNFQGNPATENNNQGK
ncbi:MAG TPA: preprotein translocase subunit SecG [Bacteroidales bacterium]|nr:preprotein translocase subunit SecG [Bacteroidales bacterium]